MRTIAEIRRSNLQYIIDSRFNGVVNRLATACGVHNTQIARVVASGKSQRNMGDKMARLIEKTVCLTEGWMDQQHAAGDALSAKIALLDTKSRLALETVIDCLLPRGQNGEGRDPLHP